MTLSFWPLWLWKLIPTDKNGARVCAGAEHVPLWAQNGHDQRRHVLQGAGTSKICIQMIFRVVIIAEKGGSSTFILHPPRLIILCNKCFT